MEAKAIPAFYCCYLLRSTIRHASVYVGSTPNPVRRLAQHNGLAKGGAVRTSRATLRPWEMTCIVSGFTSQIQALQFEWAMQNPHLTRHIAPEERISFPTARTKTSKKNRTRKKPGRPRTSLKDKLANMHILLRSRYFSQTPLQVRFFNDETLQIWQKVCKEAIQPVRTGIPIIMDIKQAESEGNEPANERKRRRKEDHYGKGGIEGLDTTYVGYRARLEKGQFLITEGDSIHCSVCEGALAADRDLITMCSDSECNAISHLSCLSKHFLNGDDVSRVLPDKGHCPSCNTLLSWQDLMTEMTLRLRAPKEVQRILRRKKRNAIHGPDDVTEEMDNGDEDDEAEGQLTADAVAELGEEQASEADSEDTASMLSSSPEGSMAQTSLAKTARRRRKLPSVIEETDWEDAEVIE